MIRLAGLKAAVAPHATRWRSIAPVAAAAWVTEATVAALLTVALLSAGVVGASGSPEARPQAVLPAALLPPSSPASLVQEPPPPAPTPKPPWIWPADAPISQPMWAGHPNGVDLATNLASPVRAAKDGFVTFAGGDICCVYGMYIVVAHADGWTTLYGHLSLIAVQAGEAVHQGELIGLSGNTGHVNGAHLHWELRHNGTPVDPYTFLAPP